MKVNTPALSADDAERLRKSPPLRHFRGRNNTKADVFVYRLRDLTIALKDYASRPLLIRNTLGRYLVRRETAAYRAVGRLSGLPRFLGRVGPFALATEWIDARPLSQLASDKVPDECFDRLEALVASLHQRGVALADLHHRDVLVGAQGSIHIVDLATAWVAGPRAGRIRRRLFVGFCGQDRVALARMRARFTGGEESVAVAAVGASAASWHRRGRQLKSWLDRLRRRGRRRKNDASRS